MKYLENNKKNLPWFLLFFLMGLAIGLPINGQLLVHRITAQALPKEWREGQHGLINPLLGVNFPDSTIFEELKPLQKSLEAQIQTAVSNNRADKVSVYVKDQVTSHWTGVNYTETYGPASLMKIPMMITYFKVAEAHPEILKQQIQYLGPDRNTQEKFKPTLVLVPGKYYSVENLIERMIVYSDNNALVLLFNNMDKAQLDTIFSDLSITVPKDVNENGDYITPGNFSRFFRTLYNSTYLDEEYSQKALELMARAEFKEGLAAGVPKGTIVADKFGETPQVDKDGKIVGYELHDCGIIYPPNHPYIICVMTSGQSYDSLAGVIKDISAVVYDAVKKDYK